MAIEEARPSERPLAARAAVATIAGVEEALQDPFRVADVPDGYCVECPHDRIGPDGEATLAGAPAPAHARPRSETRRASGGGSGSADRRGPSRLAALERTRRVARRSPRDTGRRCRCGVSLRPVAITRQTFQGTAPRVPAPTTVPRRLTCALSTTAFSDAAVSARTGCRSAFLAALLSAVCAATYALITDAAVVPNGSCPDDSGRMKRSLNQQGTDPINNPH